MPWTPTRSIELLIERLDSHFLQELISQIKYGKEGPENIEIRKQFLKDDPRVRKKTRFTLDFPAYYDPRFPDYSANEYEGYVVCEGPVPNDTGSVNQFLKNLFFNVHFPNIDKLIICGQPNEGEKFHDYFSVANQYGEYQITPKLQKATEGTIERLLTISNPSSNQIKTIRCIQILKMPDHHPAQLNEEDKQQLENFIGSLNDQPELSNIETVVHCAGGLGRSPTVIFSYILAKKFKDIYYGTNKEIMAKITQELTAFRKIRPAAIQKPEQYAQAIQLSLYYLYERAKKNIINFELPIVGLIGTFDTKEEEYSYLREKILELGLGVLTINAGVFEKKISFTVDYTLDDVIKNSGVSTSIDKLRNKSRPDAIKIIREGARSLVTQLFDQRLFVAIAGMGGTNGTELITDAMKALPIEMSKICVSTVAQHENYAYTECSGIQLVNSITDVCGLNRITKQIFKNVAGSIYGMIKNRANMESNPSLLKNTIAISMFGSTNACVSKCKEYFEANNYEALVFHMTGNGGQNMEAMIEQSKINALCDITTTELADLVGDGVFSAGTNRLLAAGKKSIPHLIVPGCLDMINFSEFDKAKRQHPYRNLIECNKEVTIMRTNIKENIEMGAIIAERANEALTNGSLIVIVIPRFGLSMFDHPQGKYKWYDPYANASLFASISRLSNSKIPVYFAEYHINDPGFAIIVCKIMTTMIEEKRVLSLRELQTYKIQTRENIYSKQPAKCVPSFFLTKINLKKNNAADINAEKSSNPCRKTMSLNN